MEGCGILTRKIKIDEIYTQAQEIAGKEITKDHLNQLICYE
jgi:hypothetical protein